jgi:hypothetical protein
MALYLTFLVVYGFRYYRLRLRNQDYETITMEYVGSVKIFVSLAFISVILIALNNYSFEPLF